MKLESPVIKWKQYYKEVKFCLLFDYLIPNTNISSLKVYLTNKERGSKLLWKLESIHATKWMSAKVAFKASPDVKVY
jgi:hypothetical protein